MMFSPTLGSSVRSPTSYALFSRLVLGAAGNRSRNNSSNNSGDGNNSAGRPAFVIARRGAHSTQV